MATHSPSLLARAVAFGILLSGCAAHLRAPLVIDAAANGNGSAQQIGSDCTAENGFHRGSEGAVFSSACPDSLATAYLEGYQSGYTIYLTQLEVDAMEREIESKSTELAQVTDALAAAPGGLTARDALLALVSQKHVVSNQLDELEAEVSARKAELARQRNAIAYGD